MRAQRIIISVSLFNFTTTGYLITLALLHVYNILHGGIISLVVISLGVISLGVIRVYTFNFNWSNFT